jgi:hypothetical protein
VRGRFVTALLRPGKRLGGCEIRALLRLVGAIRAFWHFCPRVEILSRIDFPYACPGVFDWCRGNRVDWMLGLAPNAAPRRQVEVSSSPMVGQLPLLPASTISVTIGSFSVMSCRDPRLVNDDIRRHDRHHGIDRRSGRCGPRFVELYQGAPSAD